MIGTGKALATLALVGAVACGSSGSTTSTGSDGGGPGSCPSAQVLCTSCDGGGFCAVACPNVSCPVSPDSGGGGADGGACPSSASTACVDCSGATFCVAGTCPEHSCPTGSDGGSDGGADGGSTGDGALPTGPAPACTGTPPAPGQSCTQPQGCTFEGTCAYCAPSLQRLGPSSCGSSDQCKWSAPSLPSNPSTCPNALPADGSPCGSSINCSYCTSAGLFSASCASLNDTFTWSIGYDAAQ